MKNYRYNVHNTFYITYLNLQINFRLYNSSQNRIKMKNIALRVFPHFITLYYKQNLNPGNRFQFTSNILLKVYTSIISGFTLLYLFISVYRNR